jgi:geranylgeranyl diphosphate synthase type II
VTLDEYSRPRLEGIEAALDSALPRPDERPTELHKAMRYSALAPGKRIRPLLCVAAAEACGGTMEQVLPTACALELVHAFSLIHDDLPAIDDDELRRGRPTCHVAFGEATAILAGDALFALAFQLIARNRESAPAEAVAEVLNLVSRASGTAGMVGGQVEDLEAELRAPDLETVDYIHERKTAALIRAAVLSGAVLVGADDERRAALSDYGWLVGRAFQIADDLLNAVGDEALLGKPVGTDEARHKATYVALFGVGETEARARELSEKAVAALQPLGEAAEPLRLLARYTVERDL